MVLQPSKTGFDSCRTVRLSRYRCMCAQGYHGIVSQSSCVAGTTSRGRLAKVSRSNTACTSLSRNTPTLVRLLTSGFMPTRLIAAEKPNMPLNHAVEGPVLGARQELRRTQPQIRLLRGLSSEPSRCAPREHLDRLIFFAAIASCGDGSMCVELLSHDSTSNKLQPLWALKEVFHSSSLAALRLQSVRASDLVRPSLRVPPSALAPSSLCIARHRVATLRRVSLPSRRCPQLHTECLLRA